MGQVADLAIGIITAPRARPTLRRSLAALRRAGFGGTIDIFAEPGSAAEPDSAAMFSTNVRWHPNASRRGLWGNWLHAARSLLRDTSTPLLMLCEDDLLLARGAARAVEHALESLPRADWGYASLYTPWHNIGERIGGIGWQAVETAPPVWGALAYVFTRDSLRAILDSSRLRGHPGPDGTDAVVHRAVLESGRRAYHHLPSLGDHADDGCSTVEHSHGSLARGVAFDATYVPTVEPPANGTPHESGSLGHNGHRLPLVTCTMVTGNRRDFALRSIECFRRQTYPHRELVIVDDGWDGLADLVPHDEGIRWHRVRPGRSIGWKRNFANELARGEIVALWDDDDWHGPQRLARQVQPILAGRADVTAFRDPLFFDLDRWAFWRCSAGLHRRMFVEDVLGGTLVYSRHLVGQNPFPDTSLAEDAAFLRSLVHRNARLEPMPSDDDYVYLRHGRNTWRFPLGGREWLRERHPRMVHDDLLFYLRRHHLSRLREELRLEPSQRIVAHV